MQKLKTFFKMAESGHLDGNENPAVIAMDAAKQVTAHFTFMGDWPRDTETEIVNVTSATGRVWMDSNLGATRAAVSMTDTSRVQREFPLPRSSVPREARSFGYACASLRIAKPWRKECSG